jgi:aryl-alcohol dehydrogenase-like predicted oxidoreductase
MDFPPVDQPRATAVINAMRTIASNHGVSIAQIALAWLLHQPQLTSVIVGAKRVEQLNDNIGATKVRLSTEELQQLDEISRLPAEYPGWMMAGWGAVRQQQLDATKAPRAIEG